MRHLRYWLGLAASSRTVLAPVLGTILVLAFVYAYPGSAVQSTWALTAICAYVLGAWLVIAVLGAEPDAQRVMRVAATGGWTRAWRGQAWLGTAIVLALTVLFLAFPTLTDAFDRTPRFGDLLAAAEVHLACGALGVTAGALLSPPRVRRPAVSVALVVATLVASVALGGTLGPLAGPGGLGRALSDSPAGHADGAVQLATLVAAALVVLGFRLARRLEGQAAT